MLRGAIAASFAEAYVDDLVDREREQARDFLSGATVGETAFRQAVAAFGYESAVLLDERGRLLRVAPPAPRLLGQDLTRRYEYLRLAADGQVAVSKAVLSAPRRRPVVAFAVPFQTPHGRRVFAGGFRSGGQDWLGSTQRLFVTRDITERKQWEEQRAQLLAQVEALARTDALTGVANRRVWDEELPRELGRSLRTGDPLCVAIMDLDHFKRYNDTHGHQGGDRLLKETAAAWRNTVRSTDLLARYGGEEFALLAPSCPLEDVGFLADRLRSAVPGGATVSIGVAAWDGQESADELVARADSALYAAKRAARPLRHRLN